MTDIIPISQLPPIPAKRYFTIGEVSELCGVKPHVLRYWEQEFTQLKPVKRRGNRRYYQHHEVLLIRKIRELLYEQGFTISGARNRLDGAETPALQTKPVAALLPQQPLLDQLETTLTSETNVVDFMHFKNEIRAVIDLLRA
jgi:DNA-binding transcriptional MerR regulator